MIFCGLCHIQKILKYKFEHKNHNVENYKIFFKILPIKEVNLKWINNRTTASTLEDLKNCDEKYAPKNWEKIVKEALNGN